MSQKTTTLLQIQIDDPNEQAGKIPLALNPHHIVSAYVSTDGNDNACLMLSVLGRPTPFIVDYFTPHRRALKIKEMLDNPTKYLTEEEQNQLARQLALLMHSANLDMPEGHRDITDLLDDPRVQDKVQAAAADMLKPTIDAMNAADMRKLAQKAHGDLVYLWQSTLHKS